MCDYSLHANPNRLAIKGEQLVAHRFLEGAIGFASPAELNSVSGGKIWTRIRGWFASPRATAVCVPPGARLEMQDIPTEMQKALGVGETEEVTFVEISLIEYTFRDAIRFQNGQQLLLQALREGQRAKVVSIAASEPEVEEPLVTEQAG